MNTEYELKMERRNKVVDKIAVIFLVIIYCVFLLMVDYIYFCFWVGRGNKTIINNISAEQIETIETECHITIPEDAENIKLTQEHFDDNIYYYYLYYETSEYPDGLTIEVKDYYSGDLDYSPLKILLIEEGYTPSLDWYTEIFYLDAAITLIIVIIILKERKRTKDKRLKELQEQNENNKHKYNYDFLES